MGREAVRAFWTNLYETDGLFLSFGPTSSEVSRVGDMGYALGTYEMTPPDGSEDRGKYVGAWVKEDEEWRIAADIFNSNSPPGG